MKKVVSPLKPGMKGPAVVNLQDALLECLDRAAFLANDEGRRRELSEAVKRDMAEKAFGDFTGKAINEFQRERRLPRSGEVDEPTALAINSLLQDWGLLDGATAREAQIVSGTVKREEGTPLPGARVRAFHRGETASVRLGEDTTDDEGRYTIRYELLPGVESLQLRVSVMSGDGKALQNSKVISPAGPVETVNLVVPRVPARADLQRLQGAVLLEHGSPAHQLKLRLYRRDFGGKATLVGEATTVAGGRYSLAYDAGDGPVSLEVRAVRDDGQEVPLSRPINRLAADSTAEVNLVAPGALQALAAEYDRLAVDLAPHVGHLRELAKAQENGTQQDLTVLNRATGWDARLIVLAALSERLGADEEVKLPPAVAYGLLRAGLPSDKNRLSQVDPDVVEKALKKVRDAGIVPFSDGDIGQHKAAFTEFATRMRLAIPAPGSRSSYGDLLRSSGLSEDAQARFAPVFTRHRGAGAELWAEARKAGLDEAQIGTLRAQGKLAFLAGNSEAMTTRLMGKGLKDPAELAAQDYHDAAKWISEVFDQVGIPPDRRAALTDDDRKKLEAVIPAAYGGQRTEARLEAYAADMARKVRRSYPTQVLGRLLETDEKFKLAAGHEETVALLQQAAAQGFRLGETPAAAFLKSQPGVRGVLNDTQLEVATQQLKSLQRVYQITPSNDAMPVLAKLGITSAFDVMAYSEERFIELYTTAYKEIYEQA